MEHNVDKRIAAMQPGKKPTLKTIARLSGLAVPTVSRALNDAPDINADTKKLVRRIADEVGYIPNRAGVRLRTGRTNVISLVLSTEHDQMNHTARLVSSLAGALRDTPFHLIVTPFFPDEDPLRPIKYLVETRSADAIIFNQTTYDDPRVKFLMDAHYPFATHGRSKWSARHAYGDYDNVAYGRVGLTHLVGRGRKNILMIAPPRHHMYSMNMVQGASEAAAALGVKFQVLDTATSDGHMIAVTQAVEKKLAVEPDITGLICGSTNSAIAATAGIEALGRKIGDDIDVFAKEAMPFLRQFRKKIIILPENVRNVGEFLAQAAMQAIREPDAPPMQFLEVPTEEDIGTY